VALQGTLDTFALPDVLRLLATTKKSGRLHLTGSRGSGSVYVDSGGVVGTDASGARHASTAVEVLFELLRFGDGSFVFEADRSAPNPTSPVEVEPLLSDAERLLNEWRAIEAVVPSLDSWVALAPELPKGDVVIDSVRWRTIVAIGSGSTVWTIGEALNLGEVPVSRAVKELVEIGLATIGKQDDAEAEPATATATATDFSSQAFGIGLPDHLSGNGNGKIHRIELEPEAEDTTAADVLAEALPSSAFADAPPDEADEVARQLANLSPQAARAVAAAAQATTDEEREAALAQVPEDEEPINRGLLLKFLSSVRS
jgi:hypothetical protein